jgi:dGTPase
LVPGVANLLPGLNGIDAGSRNAMHAAVAYVGGMTDRFACRQGVTLLGWPVDRLPKGIGTQA